MLPLLALAALVAFFALRKTGTPSSSTTFVPRPTLSTDGDEAPDATVPPRDAECDPSIEICDEEELPHGTRDKPPQPTAAPQASTFAAAAAEIARTMHELPPEEPQQFGESM